MLMQTAGRASRAYGKERNRWFLVSWRS